MPKFIEMTGQSCGQLTVLRQAEPDGRPKIKWLCVCVCGNTTTVDGAKLRSGHTRSCGSCGALSRPAHDKFLANVRRVESGCLEWTGNTNGVGYGVIFTGREGGTATGKSYAHRWAYEYYVGPIPDGLHIDHLCRNRLCANVAHLEPVTCAENVLRGEGLWAQNARKTHCPAGHPYSGSNLYVNRQGQRRCRECGRAQCAATRRRSARKAG